MTLIFGLQLKDMGGSSSKAAENYASVVNNSITTIVNDVAMQCESDFETRNRLVFVANYEGAQNLNAEWVIQQSNIASVNAECLQNSEVYNTASATIANDIEQLAKAVQAGVIPPPQVANTTELVNNVNQQIMNTYESECVNKFMSENTALFLLNFSNTNNLNLRFDLSQGNAVDFVSNCILNSVTSTDAYQQLTNAISQTAETESKSILATIAILFLVLSVFMVVVYFFGKNFAKWFLQTGLSVILVAVLAIAVLAGAVVLFQWLTSTGLFGTTRGEEPYTLYDQNGTYNSETGTFDCVEGKGVKIDGFLNCVDPKYDPETTFYSYWCGGDTQTFDNFRLDVAYFVPGKDYMQNGRLNAEWTKRMSRLPPQMFAGINVNEWPVDTFIVSTNTGEQITLGKWPMHSRYEYADGKPFGDVLEVETIDDFLDIPSMKYYNSTWLSVNPGTKSLGATLTAEYISAVMSSYSMGICTTRGTQTSGLSSIYTAIPTTDLWTIDQRAEWYPAASELDGIPLSSGSGAEIFYNLAEGVNIEYGWSAIYTAFERWLGRYTDSLTYVSTIADEPYSEDSWFDFFTASQNNWKASVYITQDKGFGTHIYTAGELLGEALFNYRNSIIQSNVSEAYQNASPYNKAWPGTRGVLHAEELQARNTANFGVDVVLPNSMTQYPVWTSNERGYLCFTTKDTFEFISTIGESLVVSAEDCHFLSERARSTRQCLRSENLASKTGHLAYNWGCVDYLNRSGGASVNTYSACCAWDYLNECIDYASVVNPFRCDQRSQLSDDELQFAARTSDSVHSACKANTKGVSSVVETKSGGCSADTEDSQSALIISKPLQPGERVNEAINMFDPTPSNPLLCPYQNVFECQTPYFIVNSSSTIPCSNRGYKYRGSNVPTEWTNGGNNSYNPRNGSFRKAVCVPDEIANDDNKLKLYEPYSAYCALDDCEPVEACASSE